MLGPLPPRRYDPAYCEARQVAWDVYIEIRACRRCRQPHLQRFHRELIAGVAEIHNGHQRGDDHEAAEGKRQLHRDPVASGQDEPVQHGAM
jgi:hypothetical protein